MTEKPGKRAGPPGALSDATRKASSIRRGPGRGRADKGPTATVLGQRQRPARTHPPASDNESLSQRARQRQDGTTGLARTVSPPSPGENPSGACEKKVPPTVPTGHRLSPASRQSASPPEKSRWEKAQQKKAHGKRSQRPVLATGAAGPGPGGRGTRLSLPHETHQQRGKASRPLSLSLSNRALRGPRAFVARFSVPRLKAAREKKDPRRPGGRPHSAHRPARLRKKRTRVATQPAGNRSSQGRPDTGWPPGRSGSIACLATKGAGEAPPPRRPRHAGGSLSFSLSLAHSVGFRVRARAAGHRGRPLPLKKVLPAKAGPQLRAEEGERLQHGLGTGCRHPGSTAHRAAAVAEPPSSEVAGRGQAARPTGCPPPPFPHTLDTLANKVGSGERGAATSARRALLGALGQGPGENPGHVRHRLPATAADRQPKNAPAERAPA